jgi:hypothetical protein
MPAAVPWGTIIASLPALVDAAGRLLKKADQPPKSLPEVPANEAAAQLEAVIKRLQYFESLEADQAKLLQQALEQLQSVSVTASVTARRANLALGLAAVAAVAAVASLLVVLVLR